MVVKDVRILPGGGGGVDKRGDIPCRFFKRYGKCRFGDKCAFKHVQGDKKRALAVQDATPREKLTPAELRYCAKHKRCFNCGEVGEYSRDCKKGADVRKKWRLELKQLGELSAVAYQSSCHRPAPTWALPALILM